MLYAVAGVSGHTGRVVAETLLSAGERVRVIVRDANKGTEWKARGAEVAVADLEDSAALASALTGVHGAYLLLPPRMAPGFRAYQDKTGASIVRAVEQAKPKHTVFLSSIGAQHEAGTGPIAGLYPVEQGLRAAHAQYKDLHVTFLRAGYFMENLGGSLGALAQGIFPVFSPVDFPIQMIATADIGRTAATVLKEGGSGVEIVELGGPARTANDAAAALTALTGRPIQAVCAPIENLVPTFTSMGMPEDLAMLYRELVEGMHSGKVAWEPGQRRLLGTTSLETVLGNMLAAKA